MNKYIAQYFKKTTKIADEVLGNPIITLQFFQWQNGMVIAGMNEVLDFLKANTNTSKYQIKYLEEGSIANKKEVILELEGPYKEFGKWEGVIDGILARSCSIATNARRIVEAANGKEVIFMGDRGDHYLMQSIDGYAASVGGIKIGVTDAHVEKTGGKSVGTIPHALIQMHKGDLIKTLESYEKLFPNEDLVALIDFNNDVIGDGLKALKRFGKKISAVRVDTSSAISDKFFDNKKDKELGVTVNLIKGLREALDKNDGKHVKIIVSSGFDEKKILDFEKNKTPVDVYGVGGDVLKVRFNVSADAVKLDGKEISKFGRKYNGPTNLITFNKE